MAQTAIVCENCGYDFPSSDITAKFKKRGFAHSTLADIALMVCSFAVAFGCLTSVMAIFLLTINGHFFHGLVMAPLSFLLQLGMLVVFLRVQE